MLNKDPAIDTYLRVMIRPDGVGRRQSICIIILTVINVLYILKHRYKVIFWGNVMYCKYNRLLTTTAVRNSYKNYL